MIERSVCRRTALNAFWQQVQIATAEAERHAAALDAAAAAEEAAEAAEKAKEEADKKAEEDKEAESNG